MGFKVNKEKKENIQWWTIEQGANIGRLKDLSGAEGLLESRGMFWKDKL